MRARTRRLVGDTLLAAGEACPDKIAIVCDDERYSYGNLLVSAQRLARALQEGGVRRGDRVAIHLENSWPAAVSVFGALLAGGVPTMIHPQVKSEKLAYVLADCEASALVGESQLAAAFLPALAHAPSVRCVICVGEPIAAPREVIAFEEVMRVAPPALRATGVIPIDLAALIYTSGSTGDPKGVMLSHQSLLFVHGSIIDYLRLDADDRILNVLSLAFSYGLCQLHTAVNLGATLVLERSFAFPVPVMERAAAEAITCFPLVPTIAATLLSLARRTGLVLPEVRCITNAGAALPVDFIARLGEVFPNALLFPMYGLTECKRVCYLEPELVAQKWGSVGKAIPGTEALVLSPDGEPVAPGEPGILHVRGPHVMLGYWKKPELTARMLKPGPLPGERMLCTHDVFRVDEEGFLYFVGRTDDIIKTRGEKVSPTEVENVIYELPGVREAAVVGVPDEVLGEAVRAFVVIEEGATITAQDIRRGCQARLESFKVPRDVVFVGELPKTASGKVRRKTLAEVSA